MGVLRFLLAVSVLIGHSDHSFGFPDINNTMSVRTFYIISGFYMALVLNTKYAELPYYTFIRSRYLRLFPAYITVVALTVSYGFVTYFTTGSFEWPLTGWVRTLSELKFNTIVFYTLTNVFMFGQDIISYFHVTQNGNMLFDLFNKHRVYGFDAYMLVPQAWTLGLELCFYLVSPFLVKRSVLTITATIVGSFALKFAVFPFFNLDTQAFGYKFFPFEIVYFCLGALSYKLYRHDKFKYLRSKHHYGIVLLLSAIYFLTHINAPEWARYLSISSCIPSLFAITKSNKADRLIGELSYPIYITHILVFYCLTQYTKLGTELPGLVATIILSFLIYYFVDRTIDAKREKLVSTDISRYPSLKTVFACVGLVFLTLSIPFIAKYFIDRANIERSITLTDLDLIANSPVKIVQTGFEPMETDSVSKWRWALGNKSELIFSLPERANPTFTFQFVSPTDDQSVSVYFNHTLIETIPCKKDEVIYRTLPFVGSKQDNVIQFTYADWNGKEKQFISNDSRPLAVCFNVLQFSFKPAKPTEGN